MIWDKVNFAEVVAHFLAEIQKQRCVLWYPHCPTRIQIGEGVGLAGKVHDERAEREICWKIEYRRLRSHGFLKRQHWYPPVIYDYVDYATGGEPEPCHAHDIPCTPFRRGGEFRFVFLFFFLFALGFVLFAPF